MAKQPKNKHAPGKAPKPPALKKPKKDTAPKRSHNLVDPEKAEAFRHDVEQWQALNAKAESAKDKLKAFEKGALKNDGFSVKMVKDAVLLATPEGQAQFRAEMAARLTTAAFLNMKIGEQLPLFLDGGSALSGDPEKRAYDEGQSASMANQPMKPPYDPDTKEYAAFAKGYHTHQEKLALGGISKMEKAKGATVAAEKAAGSVPAAAPRRGRSPKALSPETVKAAADRAEARGAQKDSGPPKRGASPSLEHFSETEGNA